MWQGGPHMWQGGPHMWHAGWTAHVACRVDRRMCGWGASFDTEHSSCKASSKHIRGHILSSLSRLVPAPGIFSYPRRDWVPRRVYSLLPRYIPRTPGAYVYGMPWHYGNLSGAVLRHYPLSAFANDPVAAFVQVRIE